VPATKNAPKTIGDLAAAEYRKGTSLPAARKAIAAATGRDASTLFGVVDPIYFRLAGLAEPIVLPASAGKPGTKSYASALARATKARRDRGVRWETVAASIEATVGRKVSPAEAKALYAAAGGDLDSSYVGRGTRVGAPATYAALASTVAAAASDAAPAKRATKAKAS
jgi:hypothetical protein